MNDGTHFNRQFLRACLDQDRYQFQPSAWHRLRELQISLNDALHVLRTGSIDRDPDFDTSAAHWRFTITGRTVDEKEFTISFAFVEVEGVLILTIA
jgi:hypothetical protein